MRKYAKAITGAIVVALGALGTALTQGEGHVSYQAVIAIVVSFLYSLGVIWGVPNLPIVAVSRMLSATGWQVYAKEVYAAFLAGLAAFATAYTQGHGVIGWPAVIAIAITFVAALGAVLGVSNTPGPTPAPSPAAGGPPQHQRRH